MLSSLNELFAATLLFVGAHFLLSSGSLRAQLVHRLGAGGFQTLYALTVLAAFVWMLFSYGDAPYVELWPYNPGLFWITHTLMLVSVFLVVAGLTTQNPTAVGGQKYLTGGPERCSVGILSITRHPFLWGASVWAVSHMVVNGDAASVIMMTGILVLSIGGMHHIDRRRETNMGSDWGPFAMTTSLVPFAAIASGRTRLDLKGIGWWRLLLAIAVYAALLLLHSDLFGVSPFPA